jgi:predicted nucleotidyltransferase
MIEMNRKQIAEEFSKSLDYSEIKEIILFGSSWRRYRGF